PPAGPGRLRSAPCGGGCGGAAARPSASPPNPAARPKRRGRAPPPPRTPPLARPPRWPARRPGGRLTRCSPPPPAPPSPPPRALAGLGVDLDQAREALRGVDIAGTTDERPEEAGRRQMVIHVLDDRLTVDAADPAIVAAGRAALRALGEEAAASGVIRGDQAVGASLAAVWHALRDSLAPLH